MGLWFDTKVFKHHLFGYMWDNQAKVFPCINNNKNINNMSYADDLKNPSRPIAAFFLTCFNPFCKPELQSRTDCRERLWTDRLAKGTGS